MIDKNKIINDVLREYSFLSESGGVIPESMLVESDRLITAVENCGYTDFFSNKKLLESLTINKAKRLSDSDIHFLKSLIGSRWQITDDEIKSFNPSSVQISNNFPGHETDPREVPYETVERILKDTIQSGHKLKITKAPTKVRLYAGNQKISYFRIGSGIKINGKEFLKFLVLLDFYKKYSKHIEIQTAKEGDTSPKDASAIENEHIQVSQLNQYFQKNVDGTRYSLYIKDDKSVVNCGVNISGAVHTGAKAVKSDITLLDDQKQVFWISFKDANYLDSSLLSLEKKIGFMHYGPTLSIGEKMGDDPVWKSLMVKLVGGLSKNLKPYAIDVTNKIVKFNDKTGKLESIGGRSIDDIFKGNTKIIGILLAKSKAIKKLVDSTSQRKVFYITPEKFEATLDFLDGTDVTKEIAGKAIYGINFKLDTSAPFGPDNVNILMQSKTPISITTHDVPNKEPSMLIQTDNRGHIIFNPHLPLPKDMEDPILKYKPVFLTRYVENELHSAELDGTRHLFLRMRTFIVPGGRYLNAVDLA